MILYDYYKITKTGINSDVSDNYIDFAISITMDFDYEKSGDYRNMIDFTILLMKKTEIDYIDGDLIVCKFSDIITNNLDLIKEYIRKNWNEDFKYCLDDDCIKHGELHYEVLKEFDNVINGRYNEKCNKQYLQLLKKCK